MRVSVRVHDLGKIRTSAGPTYSVELDARRIQKK